MFAGSRFRGGAALLILALLMPAAQAENRQKARDAYRRASQHYDLGEYGDALNAFKEAYRQYEEPSLLFNIAQCYRQLNDNEAAIRFYRTYLIKASDAPNRAEVRDLIAQLEKAGSQERAHKSPPAPANTPGDESGKAAPKPGLAPTVTPAPAALVQTALAPPQTEKRPLYRRAWLWVAVGAVAGAGGGVGLGLGLGHAGTPSATTDLGTYKPGF